MKPRRDFGDTFLGSSRRLDLALPSFLRCLLVAGLSQNLGRGQINFGLSFGAPSLALSEKFVSKGRERWMRQTASDGLSVKETVLMLHEWVAY